jgi:hypothetical protein
MEEMDFEKKEGWVMQKQHIPLFISTIFRASLFAFEDLVIDFFTIIYNSIIELTFCIVYKENIIFFAI